MARLFLEDFGSSQHRQATIPSTPMSETDRLESYEQGYAAGWEDATKAAHDDGGGTAPGFANSLEDISFTYHEAYEHVLNSLKPVIREMVGKLLPRIAQAGLPDLVVERMESLIRDAAAAPMSLRVSPMDYDHVAALLPADPGFALVVEEDDTLSEGQVFFKAATLEEEIDTQATLAAIATAVDEFFTLNERQTAHG